MRLTSFPLLSKIIILDCLLSNVSYILSSFVVIFTGRKKEEDKQETTEKKIIQSIYYYKIILSIDIIQTLYLRLWINE